MDIGEMLKRLLVGVLCLGFVAMLVLGLREVTREEQQITQRILDLGYDVEDVRVFCESTGINRSDFILSPSLRKQYKIFAEGGDSQFLSDARQRKTAKEASNEAASAAFSGGFVGGMAAGMMNGGSQ